MKGFLVLSATLLLFMKGAFSQGLSQQKGVGHNSRICRSFPSHYILCIMLNNGPILWAVVREVWAYCPPQCRKKYLKAPSALVISPYSQYWINPGWVPLCTTQRCQHKLGSGEYTTHWHCVFMGRVEVHSWAGGVVESGGSGGKLCCWSRPACKAVRPYTEALPSSAQLRNTEEPPQGKGTLTPWPRGGSSLTYGFLGSASNHGHVAWGQRLGPICTSPPWAGTSSCQPTLCPVPPSLPSFLCSDLLLCQPVGTLKHFENNLLCL